MKIGLFLQDNTLTYEKIDKTFYQTLQCAKKNNLDLLVFPEFTYCPDDDILNKSNFFDYGYDEEYKYDDIIEIYKEYAKEANCPIIISKFDNEGYIYGLFVSPFSDEIKWYGKHIGTEFSSFDLCDYDEAISEIFSPIEYKGFKIGITICYDSTKPLFSKAYGDIDILLNLTGGHVDYKKWSIYQKGRALECKCTNLCVMSYYNEEARNNSYIFAFDGFGKKIPYTIINNKTLKNNHCRNGLYLFEINKKSPDFRNFNVKDGEDDEFLDSKATINKNITFSVSKNEILKFLTDKNQIDDGLYVIKLPEYNLIIADLPENEIENPILVENLLYNEALKQYKNKKYLILNRWDNLNYEYYKKRLSTILKTRAAENFCIVMLLSNIIDTCIQVGLNKNVQIIKCDNNKYGLDLKRASGPESFWKNSSSGVKKAWREKYEMLVDKLYSEM